MRVRPIVALQLFDEAKDHVALRKNEVMRVGLAACFSCCDEECFVDEEATQH
jgi:hypothetical protein